MAQHRKEANLIEQAHVRLARPSDVLTIASLLVEGFGHEYGGMWREPAGRRVFERMYLLPGRLRDVIVAVDAADVPVGVAGLRTSDMYSAWDNHEQLIIHQELGVGWLLRLELISAFVDPLPYTVKRHEAFVYSVAVTAAWQRRGVASAMMERLHQMARERNKTVVVLEVVERNHAARRLYEQQGYHVRQRRRALLAWLPFGPSPRLLLEKQL
jgi:ribosomal protein S18 acetylase RimI-like enzyme